MLQVLLDGVNIRELQLRWYRQQLALVSQEPTLFATTIAANISYGCRGASQADIEAAARSANALVFIDKLPLRCLCVCVPLNPVLHVPHSTDQPCTVQLCTGQMCTAGACAVWAYTS